MRHLFNKIFGSFLISIISLSCLILYFTFITIRTHYYDMLSKELTHNNFILRLNITPVLEQQRYSELDSIVKTTGAGIDTRITIIDTTGRVLADSKLNPELMENHASRPEIIEAKKKGRGESVRFSASTHEDMMYMVLPVVSGERILGYSRLSLYLKNVNLLINELLNKILNISIVVIIISLFVILIFSRNITKPISTLASAAKKVAEGKFDTKVFLKNKDELKELADSFNNMTSYIKSLFEQISLQKEELNGVIKAIREALFVMDINGKILFFNEAFLKIVKSHDIEGKSYGEVLPDEHFDEFINKILRKQKSMNDEFELDGKFYLCSASYVGAKEEIVLLMYDITQVKILEDIKRDFIVNVSHELRTPLTAIKGFVETMEDDIDTEKKRYWEIIRRHTDRLINIVEDLLILSKLEDNAGSKLYKVKVNIKDNLDNVLKIFEQRISQKKLKLSLKIPEELPKIKIDPFKIEQMLINLIDNAIKYTDEGEICIELIKTDSFLQIVIADTGIGIPKEKIERIFERFYIADKSRSRRVGGTGLGLSIVKHIVQLHGGEILVESSTLSGTKFTIRLPLKEKNKKSKKNIPDDNSNSA